MPKESAPSEPDVPLTLKESSTLDPDVHLPSALTTPNVKLPLDADTYTLEELPLSVESNTSPVKPKSSELDVFTTSA